MAAKSYLYTNMTLNPKPRRRISLTSLRLKLGIPSKYEPILGDSPLTAEFNSPQLSVNRNDTDNPLSETNVSPKDSDHSPTSSYSNTSDISHKTSFQVIPFPLSPPQGPTYDELRRKVSLETMTTIELKEMDEWIDIQVKASLRMTARLESLDDSYCSD